ncbi:helix-turn-helix domain-containing protein [Isoptericola sp. b441]|uniref:Helix-turn-helix domain-containing protein n=1 Tax=Actinotalea lenta TaxID=3064654 RepID=A0ABT9DBM2_9CELL|nr:MULTISPECIES: helix-turn-helix domain-containing protein [unclassified Isoptericola]MDO8106706.1 helix-turn-helix domain-containing protein [Isoptericola sp. b441]MDO8121582.1 helix-turn-helix domain-containing protein [Isoptericola sp. b490]
MARPERGDEADATRHAALASPVRRQALALLSGGPLTAADLAARLGLHVTTARFHLDQLEEAGLVLRQTARSGGRGRPAVAYRAAELDLVAVRDRMIEALAGAAATGEPARTAGRRWGEELTVPDGEAREVLTTATAALGFDPEEAPAGLRLRACPFRDAARHHPEVVCQVHLGLLQGLATRAPGGDRLEIGLVPFAEPGACLLTVAATR